jgi:predicted phosphodiesterase
MSLEIQVVSDLHLEFISDKKVFNVIKPSAKILALLGDICCVGDSNDFESFKRFIMEILPHYEQIIMVPGNHEYYYNPIDNSTHPNKFNVLEACNAKIKTFFKETSKKLHYLNNTAVKMTVGKKKYVIIGSTLWSYIPKSEQERMANQMSDYKYIYVQDNNVGKIRNLGPADVSALFTKNYRYLKTASIKAGISGAKVIIFTHHKPYLDKTYDIKSLDVAYQSDCSEIANSKYVSLWCYGHTHIKDDKIIKGVRYYSMPKGYPRQQTGFDKSAKIKV